jgi:starch synthase
MTVVSRLTAQKGLDWLLDCAPDFIRRGGRIAILGEGDGGLENRCRQYCRQFAGAFGYWARYDDSIARKFFAGADLFAMPSRFEPCGLGQLYAMRYGAIPVARRTGGLGDTIFPLLNKFDVGGATGILYDGDRTESLLGTLRWALDVARDDGAMTALRKNAMSVDHSWEQSAKCYLALYDSIEQASTPLNL